VWIRWSREKAAKKRVMIRFKIVFVGVQEVREDN